ncbi:MAG: hypothetical protein QOK30_2623 [Nocardioidaceae bacterium]|nr:hypothetical protein [Nocardioidaceae bacterium]
MTRATPDAAPVPVPASLADAVMETLVPRFTDDPSGGEVIATVGAAASMRIRWECSASLLPALSVDANLTVVVDDTVNGPLYATAVALVSGLVPSVV